MEAIVVSTRAIEYFIILSTSGVSGKFKKNQWRLGGGIEGLTPNP